MIPQIVIKNPGSTNNGGNTGTGGGTTTQPTSIVVNLPENMVSLHPSINLPEGSIKVLLDNAGGGGGSSGPNNISLTNPSLSLGNLTVTPSSAVTLSNPAITVNMPAGSGGNGGTAAAPAIVVQPRLEFGSHYSAAALKDLTEVHDPAATYDSLTTDGAGKKCIIKLNTKATSAAVSARVLDVDYSGSLNEYKGSGNYATTDNLVGLVRTAATSTSPAINIRPDSGSLTVSFGGPNAATANADHKILVFKNKDFHSSFTRLEQDKTTTTGADAIAGLVNYKPIHGKISLYPNKGPATFYAAGGTDANKGIVVEPVKAQDDSLIKYIVTSGNNVFDSTSSTITSAATTSHGKVIASKESLIGGDTFIRYYNISKMEVKDGDDTYTYVRCDKDGKMAPLELDINTMAGVNPYYIALEVGSWVGGDWWGGDAGLALAAPADTAAILVDPIPAGY